MRTIRFGLLVVLAWTVSVAQVVPTTTWTDFYSDGSTVNGGPIPVGALVQAFDPQGILCGEFTVQTAGSYGYMHVYGDDATTPGVDEGASEGDTITFTIQGVAAPEKGVWSAGTPGAIIQLHLHVSLGPPAAPLLVAPSDGLTGASRPVTLRWEYPVMSEPDIGQTSSRIQVATDSLFANIVLDSSGVLADSLVVEGLLGGWEYFWRVQIENTVTGAGPHSPVRSFTTIATAVVTLSHPLVDFGETAVGDTTTVRIYLRNLSAESVTVLSISTTHPHFSATPALGSVPAGDSLMIDVHYHPAQFGIHFDSLIVLSDAATSMVFAEIYGQSPRPVLEVDPQAIDFGAVAAGSAEVTCVSTSINPVTIDTMYAGTRYYRLDVPQFPVSLAPAETLRIQVHFSPDTLRAFPDMLFVVDNTLVDGGSVRGRVSLTGIGTEVTGVDVASGIPVEYGLGQNFPNPFNPSTTITFELPVRSRVDLRVYNVLGQEVRSLLLDVRKAGTHEVLFEAGSLPSGLYLYTLTVRAVDPGGGEFSRTKRMVLLK